MTKFLCGECIHNSDKGGGCLIPKNLGYVDNCNRYLPKDKPIVHTNEEYLRSLNTEQLAKVLKEMTDKCATCDTNQYDKRGECPFEICRIGLNEFVEWLKQPHTTE